VEFTNKPDFYLEKELQKQIDPVLWNYLTSIQVEGITEKQLTVVFWDISGYTRLCNAFVSDQFHEEIIHFLKKYSQRQ
jgi:hypothetical protein